MKNQGIVDQIRKTFANNSRVHHDESKMPDWYVKKMKELGDKYRNIRWLPLDVPKIEFDDFDEFLKFWEDECIDVVRTQPCAAEPWDKDNHPLGKYSNYYKPQFKGLHFYTKNPDTFETDETGIFARKYLTHPMFKRIIEQLHEYLPFHIINHAKIWESVKAVYPHRDQTFFWNCPTEFRVMLNDENPTPTLYVADIEHGDINYIDLRALETNAFCWSNGSQIHGSDFLGSRKHLICIDGILHPTKQEDLIDRSVSKYKDKINYNLNI